MEKSPIARTDAAARSAARAAAAPAAAPRSLQAAPNCDTQTTGAVNLGPGG
jgi:hypothetical protein